MPTVFPSYYPEFRCIASACRHSCCVGWEIDIDPDSLARYQTLPGALGRRLRESIQTGEDAHFRLEAGERCPFLDGQNLCQLILQGGEDLLCQICRDHPRFRNFLPSRTEVGLGLCCEAAASLILRHADPVRLCGARTKAENPEEQAFLDLRDRVFAQIWENTHPFWTRTEKILELCAARLPDKRPEAWAKFYLGLERLDPAWTEVLETLACQGRRLETERFEQRIGERAGAYPRLLHYFLYRHLAGAWEDGDIAGRAAFSVLSTKLLYWLDALYFQNRGELSLEQQAEHARMYSGEIEYSQENMDAILAVLR